jgi:hypothetical protein
VPVYIHVATVADTDNRAPTIITIDISMHERRGSEENPTLTELKQIIPGACAIVSLPYPLLELDK